MNRSRLSKRLVALALSALIAASSAMTVFALQLPPRDDEEEDDDISYTRAEALAGSVEARRKAQEEGEEYGETNIEVVTPSQKSSTTLKVGTSSGKTVTVGGSNKSAISVSSGSKTSSVLNSTGIEVVSPTQNGIAVGSKTSSSGSTATTTASTMAATIRNAQTTNNNTDIKGWLKVSGTNINYGVIKTPSNQNINYYESKGYNKQYSKNGVLWTNSSVNFGNSSTISKNTCIFGHNWTNSWRYAYANREKDVMFAQLAAFKSLDFAKKNQKITFSTEQEDMTFQIFAVFICNADTYNYVTANPTTTAFSNMIKEAQNLSFFDYDVDVSTSDKLITLSTCIDAYYKNGVRQTNQRLVVMGKLVKGDAAKSNVTVTKNADAKTPTF